MPTFSSKLHHLALGLCPSLTSLSLHILSCKVGMIMITCISQIVKSHLDNPHKILSMLPSQIPIFLASHWRVVILRLCFECKLFLLSIMLQSEQIKGEVNA